jgi:hypothetical protein
MGAALPDGRVLGFDHLDTGVVPDAVDRAGGRSFAQYGRQNAQAFGTTGTVARIR